MHETTDHYDRHDNGVLTHVYYNGTRKILECIKPTVCHYYEPFESICIRECTWCDNPYHCKYKNVSRETFCTHDQLISYLFNEWLYFEHDCSNCDSKCEFNTRCNMYRVAIDCMKRGDY